MGAQNSAAHDTHFANEYSISAPMTEDDSTPHISISTKMVERLVEDALATGSPAQAQTPVATRAPPSPRDKDHILSDKLKALDNSHSEKLGLTIDDVHATARRIEMRTAHMTTQEPVCKDLELRVLKCYEDNPTPDKEHQCWEAVNEFSRCVQYTVTRGLLVRTAMDEQHAAKLRGHVEQARERLVNNPGGPKLSSVA